MTLLGVLLAGLVGLLLGLLGGGGSILTVPIFVYVLGFEAKSAIGMSLAVVGLTSLVGALIHWRAGNVRWRIAFSFGAVAMVGTWVGARVATLVSGTAQLALFGVILLVASYFMLRGRAPVPAGAAKPAGRPIARVIAEAFAVGLITGLVGVGGGFLIVPALVLLGRLPVKQAIGTSLVVIALNSAVGFAGYLGQAPIAWDVLIGFSLAAAAAIGAGARLARYLPPTALRRSFGVFLIVVGLFILYQNRAVIRPAADWVAAQAHTVDVRR